MEKEIGRRARCLPPEPGPYPWMFFWHGKGYKNHAFYDITKSEKTILKRISELCDIKFVVSCQGWFLTLSEKDECSLWNPVTLETIQLPSVLLKPKQEICHGIVTASPGIPDSFVILFVEFVPLLIFCKVGDQHWTEQRYNKEINTIGECPELKDYFIQAVCCNEKIYAMTYRKGRLAVMDGIGSDRLIIKSLQTGVPYPQETTERFHRRLVEFSGELFVINLIFGGLAYNDVIAVELSRLDFSRMEWNKVKSTNDRVFFLDDESVICCPAVHEPDVHGNRIYFTLHNDKSMYSYNVEDKSVSVFSPCPNLPTPWCSPIWLRPDFRPSPLIEGEELKSEIQETVKYVTSDKQEVEGYFGVLDLDVLSLIASHLSFYDYMSFRAVNMDCRLAATPLRWETTLKKLDCGFLTPWLIVPDNSEGICTFIDPLRGERYLMNMPNMSKGATIHSSKNGWCVMLGEKNEVCLWNPFAKKTISLPNISQDCYIVRGCCLLSSPNSPGCAVIFVSDYFSGYTCIDYFDLDKGQWSTYFAFDCQDFRPTLNNNPVPYKGSFFFLNSEGKLGVFKEVEDHLVLAGEVLDKPKKPCKSFKQSYLLECKGKLLSVFVGFLGKWVQVFELDFSSISWMKCENLGNYSLYVSRISSFAIEATNGMENKVFFPRFYGKNLVYYSLDSGKCHCYGGTDEDDVMVDFYGTKEQLLCSWIEPKWL